MILAEFFNDKHKKVLNNLLADYISHLGEQKETNTYLLHNIYDDDGLEVVEKSFLIDLKQDLKIIDVVVQKKIYDNSTNLIFDVTYGNVFKSNRTPFILDSCFFRLYFDTSNNSVVDKTPYNVECYYSSAFSDNLKNISP